MRKLNVLKKLNKPAHPLLSVVGIACAIVFFLIVLFVVNRTLLQAPSQNSSTISVSQQGWKTFVYPDTNKKYTFDYPTSWKVDLDKNMFQDKDSFDVSLLYNTGVYGFKGAAFPTASSTHGQTGIFFHSREAGSGYPSADYIKTEKHTYGGKSAIVETLYRNNKPYESYIKFDDEINGTATQKDSIIDIEITYPDTGLEQYQQTIDQIFTSLKFY
jgi:hypothetical protein